MFFVKEACAQTVNYQCNSVGFVPPLGFVPPYLVDLGTSQIIFLEKRHIISEFWPPPAAENGFYCIENADFYW